MRISIILTISLSLSMTAVVQAAQPQAVAAINGSGKLTSECRKLSNAISKSRSYAKIISTLQNSKKQLPGCKAALQKDRQLNSHIRRVAQQEEQRLKSAMLKSMAAKSRVVPSGKLKINQRLTRFKAQGKRKLDSLKASATGKREIMELDNVTRPNASSPVKATITPTTIVPGTFAAIEGNGIHFGNRQGRVELQIGNSVIPAVINTWRPDWIGVQFPENISGFPISNTNAAVIVRNGDLGSRTHINVDFMPVYEQIEVWDAYSVLSFPPDIFNIAGSTGTKTLFANAALGAHWHITDVEFYDLYGANCQRGTPFATMGGNRLSSNIRWTRNWNQSFSCSIVATVEGPRGVPSGTEGLHLN